MYSAADGPGGPILGGTSLSYCMTGTNSVSAKFCVLNMSLQEKSGMIESKTYFIDRFFSLCCV